MFTKSPVFYASLAMIAAAMFTVASLTVLHPKNYAWVVLPVMSTVVFLSALLGQDAAGTRNHEEEK